MTCTICENWQTPTVDDTDEAFDSARPVRSIPKTCVELGTDWLDILAPYGPEHLLQHGIKHCDVNAKEVHLQYGTWAVTKYGIECLAHYYPIKKERLADPTWPAHMSEKEWVNHQDFLAALRAGQRYHNRMEHRAVQSMPPRKPQKTAPDRDLKAITPSLRFQIFKRDGYRCQICGRAAADGVQLEADHKVPRCKGGKTTRDNLWTLCNPCNRGKASQEL